MYTQLRNQWLWACVLQLLKDHHFEPIDNPLSSEQAIFRGAENERLDQVWLVRNEGRHYQLLRLQAVDGVWPSMVARDLRRVLDQTLYFRKRLRARELDIYNLYLFTDPYDEGIDRYLQEMTDAKDDKSKVHNQGIVIREGWQPLQIRADGFDLKPLQVDTQQLKTNVEYLVQTQSLADIKRLVKNEEKKKEQAFYEVFRYGQPRLTYTFMAINLLIFFYIEWVGSSMDPATLIEYGAKWNPAIIDGEWWRLITPMFLHIGWMHLFVNSLALFFLGGAVERIYGSARFLWMYLFAGFTGTLASFAFTPNLSAGASGAIFGCFGALLYFGLKHRNLFFRTMGMDVIIIVLFNLGIGFAIPMIDNFGHIGGLVGGFLAAAMVNLPRQAVWKEKVRAISVSIIGVIALLWIGQQQWFEDPTSVMIEAELAMQAEEFDRAQTDLEQLIEDGYDEPEAYLQLGSVYAYTAQYEKAEDMFTVAQKKGADQAELYFQLSYVQLQQGNTEEGKQHLQIAMEKDPTLMEAYYNMALVYLEEGDEERAQEILQEAVDREVADERIHELLEEMMAEE